MESEGAPGRDAGRALRVSMVGRDAELGALTDWSDLAVEHGARVAFISGEAGIGKSTLVNHFLDQQRDHRWAVHVGQCIEFADRTVPFAPITSIARSILDELGDDAIDVLGHHRADVAALLPEWRTGDDSASLTGDVDRLIDAITSLLRRAAEIRPMVAFVEDVHWADPATRDVIASLIHSLGSARVLVVVTERTGALDRTHVFHTWLAEQRRFPNVHSMELRGLSTAAIAEQAAAILGHEPSDDEVAVLVERTGGNAYFASELLLAQRNGDAALPVSLADFLTSRVERLSPEEKSVVRAMAIAGGPVDHALLAAAEPDLDIGPPLRSLFDASMLVVEDGRYAFTHALMRDAILRTVLPFEAELVHRRVAEALVARRTRQPSVDDLATLAFHWAGANDIEKHLVASIEAGRAAAGVAAYENAAALMLDALDSWSRTVDPEALADTTLDGLTLETVDWLIAADQPERAVELLDEVLDDIGPSLADRRRALVMAKMAPLSYTLGEPDRSVELIESAVALVDGDRSPEAARVHLLAARISMLRSRIRPTIESADQAIEIAQLTGPDEVLVEAMSIRALGSGVTENLEAGIKLVREARRLAIEKKLVFQVANTFRREMMIIYFREGRTKRSLDVLREGVAYAEKHCGPDLRLTIIYDLALGLVEAGDLVEAEELINRLTPSLRRDWRSLSIRQLQALQQILIGDLDEAAAFLAMAEEFLIQYHERAPERGFQHRLAAEIARRQGRHQEAKLLIDAALLIQFPGDNLTYTRESVLEKARLARSLADSDPALAETTRGEVEEHLEHLDNDDQATETITELIRFELDVSRGRGEARRAKEIADRLGTNGFGADAKQTALVHAQLLSAEGADPAQLREAVAEVQRISETSGMRWLGEEAARLIGGPGRTIDLTDDSAEIDLTDTAPADDHGLTPREIEVLSMLARGLTNKEIGAELYVSHRTVSTHVSNLLAKLHLKNRSEAAAKFHELGFSQTST